MRGAEKTLRIVAADDSAVIRHMLAMLFDSMTEHADASQPKMELVATVADGVACLEAVRLLRPDLLLLDLEMPRMSGMQVLDVLHVERPQMPIFMCSAYTARGAAATLDALARGASDYVTKPSGSKTRFPRWPHFLRSCCRKSQRLPSGRGAAIVRRFTRRRRQTPL